MAISTIGQLILYLHERAEVEGRLHEDNKVANQVLRTLGNEAVKPQKKFKDLPLGVQVGLELRNGRAYSNEAKEIRQAALARLRDYDLWLAALGELGYTPQLLRAALSLHWERLESEELGSDGNCVLLDIQAVRAKAPEEVRQIIDLLPRMGPQEAGVVLQTNGSRAVGRAMATLSKMLEGRWSGKPRKRRRRKAKHNAKNTVS